MVNNLYLFSSDILNEGAENETSFHEIAVHQVVSDTGTDVITILLENGETDIGFEMITDRYELLHAIEMHYRKYGKIDKLVICCHMWEYGFNLLYGDNDRETYIRMEDFYAYPEKFKIEKILLIGSKAGREVPDGKTNIAQDLSKYYNCEVIAFCDKIKIENELIKGTQVIYEKKLDTF